MVVGKLAKHNSLCLSLLFHQFTNSLFYQMTSNKLLWQHTFCASWINWISKIVYICIREEATWCLKWTFLQLNTIFKHHLLKTQHPSQATQKILSLTRMRKQAGFFGGVLVVLLVVGNCYSQWLDFKMCQNSGAIMHPVMPMWSIEYLTSYIRSIHFHALFDLLALLRRYLE